MDNTMIIQLTNRKAIGLLHEMEELNLIKVLKVNMDSVKTKMSKNTEELSAKRMG